jgi:ketosteroid isomerase-like protein
MSATQTETMAAAEFAEFFAAGWAIGATDPEAFYAHFGRRFHPDALMEQPIVPDTRGPKALREQFAPVFKAMPDLRGEVLRWGETADGVLIELRLAGTFGERPLTWTVVDRIVLDEGFVLERRSYFDSLPLVKAMASRPRSALPLLKALLKRKESR